MMKMLLPIFCLITYVLAEPPVGDSYSSAHAHDHDHGVGIQRSLSEQYGPPSFGARNLQTQYGPPRARSKLSQTYGTPSQNYGAPAVRTPGQQYGAPAARVSQTYGVPRTPGQEYGVPATRSNSNNYLPATKSADHSRRANLFSTRTAPSTLYGAPEFRSKPSGEYGVPISSTRSNLRSTFSAQVPSEQYGIPAARSNENQGYSARNFKSSARISQSFGGSKAQSYSSQPLSSYGVPSGNDDDSYSQGYNSISETYGAPNQRDLSDSYGVPEARGLSQEYGVPSSRTSLNTNAIVLAYTNARSSPSSTYGVPSARDSMPSDQYGVPQQYNNLASQGYEYSRAALDELLNQEPANYDFAYKVNDYESGSDFGHTETRQENKAEGAYFVVLPDGTKQTVEYEADERGFKPRISVESVDLARSGGYDENASDLTRSGDGPY